MTRVIIERVLATHHNALYVGLRLAQAIVMFIALLTASVTTGISAGDFAFLLSYTVWIYASLLSHHAYMKTANGGNLLTYGWQMLVDGTFMLCLFIAGIALASSSWGSICRSSSKRGFDCSSFYTCIVFLFIGFGLQILSLFIVHFARSMEIVHFPNDPPTISTPRTEYQPAADHSSCEL